MDWGEVVANTVNPFGKLGKVKNASNIVEKIIIKRKSRGRDGGEAWHVKEVEEGKTISVTHQAQTDGEIIHQHQFHVGNYGSQREFPEEWIEYPTIGGH